MCRMAAGNHRIQCGGVHLETSGDFLSVRPPLGQRVAIKSCVFVAGVVLMLARTSPAMAADTSHGTNKGGNKTNAAVVQRTDSPPANPSQGTNKGGNKTNAAVVQRTDSPPAKHDQQVGGGDGKGDGKGGGKA